MAKAKTTAVAITAAALVLASIAAYMVYSYLGAKQREAEEAKTVVRGVVVANTEIPFGTRLQESQLKTVSWPAGSLPAGSASEPAALKDRITIASIPAGSPVLEASLAPAGGGAAGVMSYIIPDGHRAVTVAVNEVVGVAGFILPESTVDVVATVPSPSKSATDNRISKIILQNVKVLAVGQILQQKEGKPVTVPTVTLDVTPEDAEKLVIASENRVQLILKHTGDKELVKTRGETVSSLLAGQAAPKAAAAPARKASAAPKKAAARPAAVEGPYSIDVIQGDKRTKEEFR